MENLLNSSGDTVPTRKRSTQTRRTIPTSVRDEVLREAGYKCANPVCRHILTLNLHHIVWVREGGGNEATNLIALCPNCHSLHTSGHISDAAIRHWKGMLHALNHAFNKESMDLLLFLRHEDAQKMWFSGDGVLKFAGLIASGLADFSQHCFTTIPSSTGPPLSSTHKLKLTEKGKILVDAWLSGDENTYATLIKNTKMNK